MRISARSATSADVYIKKTRPPRILPHPILVDQGITNRRFGDVKSACLKAGSMVGILIAEGDVRGIAAIREQRAGRSARPSRRSARVTGMTPSEVIRPLSKPL